MTLCDKSGPELPQKSTFSEDASPGEVVEQPHSSQQTAERKPSTATK